MQDVLKKDTGGWKKVVAAFGEEILRPDGEVDRPKLGQIVFSDPEKRQLLNRWNQIFTLYFGHAHFQNIVLYCHLVYVIIWDSILETWHWDRTSIEGMRKF